MSVGIIFYILLALFFKHAIINFPIYLGHTGRNTRTELRPDELRPWILHIILHGVATFIVLMLISMNVWVCIIAGLVDFVTHFVTDYYVLKCTIRYNIDKDFERKFFWIVKLDQYIHCLVYVLITIASVLSYGVFL